MDASPTTTTTTKLPPPFPSPHRRQRRRQRRRTVALIGSSGGGTATQGHTNPLLFLDTIQQELYKLKEPVDLSRIIFVSLDNGKGMDSANLQKDPATLYYQVKNHHPRTTNDATQGPCDHNEDDDNGDDDDDDDNDTNDGTCTTTTSPPPPRVPLLVFRGTLEQVNQRIREELDPTLAQEIRQGSIDGLICVSCPVHLVSQSLGAAAYTRIPVTGTGGTSLSVMASTSQNSKYKVRLVGNAGGSVATTTRTRAISYTQALAQDWKILYQPWKNNSTTTNTTITNNPTTTSEQQASSSSLPTWRSILNSTLPAFWGVALCKKLLLTTSIGQWIPGGGSGSTKNGAICNVDILIMGLESWALPLSCAMVMATSYYSRNHPSDASSIASIAASSSSSSSSSSTVPLMAVVLACMACHQSILAGLLAGWWVPLVEERLLYACILRGNFPATMTSLITTGVTGLVVALLLLPVAGPLRSLTQTFRSLLQWIPPPSSLSDDDYFSYYLHRAILGLLGGIFCYGSKVGWYHSIFLPLILVSMELGDASLLGTLDELTLVMVSAGICTGNWWIARRTTMTTIPAKTKDDEDEDYGSSVDHHHQAAATTELMKRGMAINILCGDFVEVCYPAMDQYWIINMGGYLASIVSASMITRQCQSSAYLPVPLSIWLADDWRSMTMACLVAYGISLTATLINYYVCLEVPQQRQSSNISSRTETSSSTGRDGQQQSTNEKSS
jgi:hypothetical protein